MPAGKTDKKAARQLKAQHGIAYASALQAIRDARELPDFRDRVDEKKDQGMATVEAIVAVVNETYTWD